MLRYFWKMLLDYFVYYLFTDIMLRMLMLLELFDTIT